MNLDFSILWEYTDVLLIGAMWTVALTVCSIFFSLVLGTFLSALRLSRHVFISAPTSFFMWFFMGTPLLLQLYLIYFGLVHVGVDVNAFIAGVIALSLHFSVYNADIISASIAAVSNGQHEASRSLGLSRFQTMKTIIIPQALYNVAPALGNMMIALLKETSLVSIIGVMELTLSAQRAISETFKPFEFYFAAAALYYIANLFLERAIHTVEMRSAKYR